MRQGQRLHCGTNAWSTDIGIKMIPSMPEHIPVELAETSGAGTTSLVLHRTQVRMAGVVYLCAQEVPVLPHR